MRTQDEVYYISRYAQKWLSSSREQCPWLLSMAFALGAQRSWSRVDQINVVDAQVGTASSQIKYESVLHFLRLKKLKTGPI